MLPIGLSDSPGAALVKLYCPKCCDVYEPKARRHSHVDGCYFGTGFPHMLFMVSRALSCLLMNVFEWAFETVGIRKASLVHWRYLRLNTQERKVL